MERIKNIAKNGFYEVVFLLKGVNQMHQEDKSSKELKYVIDEYKETIYEVSLAECDNDISKAFNLQEKYINNMYESIEGTVEYYIIPKIENGEIIINKKNYENTEMGKEERVEVEKNDFYYLTLYEGVNLLTENEFEDLIKSIENEMIEMKLDLEEIAEKKEPELEI